MSVRWIGFWAGIACLLVTVLAPSPVAGLSQTEWRAAGLAALMAVWWMTEAMPIAATALVPLAVAPLVGLAPINSVASSYAHPLIFLFLGGFLLSLAMQKSQLHRRIACVTMMTVGPSPRWQLAGFMAVTAFLSMWMSNTATTVMMMPIAVSVIGLAKDGGADGRFPPSLLLGVAYAASIGGVATLIGTPPNAFMAAYLSETYGVEITFSRWMLLGVPFSGVFLVLTWLWLGRGLAKEKGDAESISVFRNQLREMGRMAAAEKRVAVVFSIAASSWIGRGLIVKFTGLPLSDAGIAVIVGMALFVLPFDRGGSGRRLLEWKDTETLPWGILLLFGGGLALAKIMQESGLADFIGRRFQDSGGYNELVVVALISLAVVFLTEITSNTATAAGLIPLFGPVAVSMGQPPATLVIPVAIAASCAFMMPVATPPNAIVFASGDIRMAQMLRAGFALNLMGVVLLTVSALAIPWLFG